MTCQNCQKNIENKKAKMLVGIEGNFYFKKAGTATPFCLHCAAKEINKTIIFLTSKF